MKRKLDVGDWATIAFFALATLLGCYERLERELPVRRPANATTASHSNPAALAVGRE